MNTDERGLRAWAVGAVLMVAVGLPTMAATPVPSGKWSFVFTDAPLALPSGHFGLGHGSGAHAPDEYFLIDSTNPKVQGFDGATMSYVEYLYELAK